MMMLKSLKVTLPPALRCRFSILCDLLHVCLSFENTQLPCYTLREKQNKKIMFMPYVYKCPMDGRGRVGGFEQGEIWGGGERQGIQKSKHIYPYYTGKQKKNKEFIHYRILFCLSLFYNFLFMSFFLLHLSFCLSVKKKFCQCVCPSVCLC